MITLGPREAGQALGLPSLATAVTGVSTDSRTLRPGDLFVALQGERYDGHDYLADAFEAGASGAVVATGRELRDLPTLQARGWTERLYPVESTVRALGQLGRAVRRRSQATVVAVTGSVGKTGTKDLIRAMASMERVVLATESNLNNEIGVPLTLLEIEAATEVVVVELGMRGFGQIAYLADLAEPDVGVITNVAAVHLELLGNVENVAQAKAELLLHLAPDGVGVVPCSCPPLEPWVGRCGRRIIRFELLDRADGQVLDGDLVEDTRSQAPECVVGRSRMCDDTRCLLSVAWPGGATEAVTPFTARYRLENAMAAAAACYAAGLSLERCLQGLSGVAFTPGRGDEYELGGLIILDHTYNANPQAVGAALEELVARARHTGGRPVAVLGDMLELGPDAPQYHEQVGRQAAQLGVRQLWAVGEFAAAMAKGYSEEGGSTGQVETATEPGLATLILKLRSSLKEGDVVLVKGSRRLRLERVVQDLVASPARC